MIITHKVKMDLISKGIAPKIHMVQGDCCSRKIEFRLFSDRSAWHVPKGAKALIRYRRPDHSVGVYDTLPDGSCAYAVAGNAVTVSVAPEALAIAGYVSLVITLFDGERELSTFEVQLDVQPNFTSGPAAEGDYASITGMIQTPDHAQVGQTVAVAAVNESGKPIKWEAVDFPEPPAKPECIPLSQGGTGATTAAKARENLGAAAAVHTHDDRYYTEEEINALLPKAFYVNITDNGDNTGIADKTRREVEAAYLSGKSVFGLLPEPGMGNLVMPLLYFNPDTGTTMFGAKDIISNTTKAAMYTTDGTDLQVMSLSEGVCTITVTDLDNGVFSIDKSLMDITAAVMTGTVCAKMTIDDTKYTFPLTSEDANYYIFSGMVGSDLLCQIAIIKSTGQCVCDLRSIEAPNPCALTINGTQYDGTHPVSMTIEPEGFVVDYVKTEAARVAKLVQSRQNANTFSFMVGSDIHARLNYTAGSYTTDRMLTSAKHAAQAMDIIRQQTHMDFGAILGDTLWDSGETADQAMEIFRTIRAYFHPAFVGAPQFWLKGNHDYLGDDAELSDNQVYAGISIHNTDVVFDSANKVGGYCYRDFADHQLRVICLALPEDGKGYGISAAQISWLRDALDVSAKGANWKTLILSHMPVDDFFWVTDFMSIITAHKDTIIANIHGHMHNYQTGTVTDTSIPRIGIPAISPYRTKDAEGNEVSTAPYQKVENTAEDTAFCVITIDFAAKKLYADHYGAGEDRVIDLSIDDSAGDTSDDQEPSNSNYTNQIPLSTEGDGTTLYNNGVGYQTGLRLNSSGEESAVSGMCVTGYIPATNGDTIRIKNVTLTGASNAYLHYFAASDKKQMGCFTVEQLTAATENGITTLTIPAADQTYGFIRLSCGVIDNASILTVNQEIL